MSDSITNRMIHLYLKQKKLPTEWTTEMECGVLWPHGSSSAAVETWAQKVRNRSVFGLAHLWSSPSQLPWTEESYCTTSAGWLAQQLPDPWKTRLTSTSFERHRCMLGTFACWRSYSDVYRPPKQYYRPSTPPHLATPPPIPHGSAPCQMHSPLNAPGPAVVDSYMMKLLA